MFSPELDETGATTILLFAFPKPLPFTKSDICFLHKGQVLATLNQLLIQKSWKICLLLQGKILILSLIAKF